MLRIGSSSRSVAPGVALGNSRDDFVIELGLVAHVLARRGMRPQVQAKTGPCGLVELLFVLLLPFVVVVCLCFVCVCVLYLLMFVVAVSGVFCVSSCFVFVAVCCFCCQTFVVLHMCVGCCVCCSLCVCLVVCCVC